MLSGQLQATTQRSDGVVNLLAVVGVGAVFGEFPDVQPCRTATVPAASDDCVVLAVQRRSRMMRTQISEILLEEGDILLVQGRPEDI